MAPLQQWHEYILFQNSAEPTECWTWYYIIHNFRRLHIIIIIMIAISTCAVCLCKQPVFGIDASRRHRWCRDFPSLHQPYAVIFQLHFDKIGTRYEYDGVRHTLREAKLLCCAHSAVKMPSSTLGMDACLSLSGCMWVSKRFVACAFCVSLYKLRWIYITNVTVGASAFWPRIAAFAPAARSNKKHMEPAIVSCSQCVCLMTNCDDCRVFYYT